MKIMNELDDIYPQRLGQALNEYYVCPVCDKVYKKLETAKAHLNKRGCHSVVDVFKDTQTEVVMFDVFVGLSFRENEKARVSLWDFRRSKQYSLVAEFFVFCMKNNIQSWERYLEYCCEYYNGHMNGMLVYMVKETTLTNYYQWSRTNISVEDSKRFLEENLEKMRDDFNFLVRSLEKGKMSLEDAIFGLGSSYFVNLSAMEKKSICDMYG